MWKSILQRVQSPRKREDTDDLSPNEKIVQFQEKNTLRHGNQMVEIQEKQIADSNLDSQVRLSISFLKNQEEQFDKMRVERDAARMVSISLANAAVSLKVGTQREILDQQASAIAWKSIANAALGMNLKAH